MLIPSNLYFLGCGCIYCNANRIKAVHCDKCEKPIAAMCIALIPYGTGFYHVECAKELDYIEKGKVIDINSYPEY